jgi:hypothetical protein
MEIYFLCRIPITTSTSYPVTRFSATTSKSRFLSQVLTDSSNLFLAQFGRIADQPTRFEVLLLPVLSSHHAPMFPSHTA